MRPLISSLTPPLSRRIHLRQLALLALFPLLLSACGGGDPLGLYTSLWIRYVDSPTERNRNESVSVEAGADYFGEISGGDLRWELKQTGGHDVGNISETLADDNRKVTYTFTAPDKTGWIYFDITVKARNFRDTKSFSIRIRD